MSNLCRPYWSKSRKRWIACQYVNGVLTTARFYSQEAAQKWYDAPLEHPHLPLRNEGKNARRRPDPKSISTLLIDDGLD